MRKVFEHPAAHEVGLCESILQSNGIRTFLRNANISGLAGEVPFASAYPELWVVEDADYPRAVAILSDYRSKPAANGAGDWVCGSCGETVPAAFARCWKCGTASRGDECAAHSDPDPRPAERESWKPGPILRYPLTLVVLLIAVAAFFLKLVLPEIAAAIFAPGAAEIYAGRWDALLGSAFLHADYFHIAFNAYWLWLFGSALEANLRRRFYALLFLSFAAFSSAAQLAFGGSPGIGLSGVIYAMFGFMWFAKGRYPAFSGVLRGNIAALLLGWLVVCFVLSWAKISPIANAAHVGGLAAGALLGWICARSGKVAAIFAAALVGVSLISVAYAPWSPIYLVLRAEALMRKGESAKAFLLLGRAGRADGELGGWASNVDAWFRQQQGDYAGAARAFEAARPKLEGDPQFLNSYAWFLATSPEPSTRDGQKAIRLATRAADLTEQKDAAILDTLAAAFAESGNFAEAIRWQTAAIAASNENPGIKARLDLYRRGLPFRDLPAETDPAK